MGRRWNTCRQDKKQPAPLKTTVQAAFAFGQCCFHPNPYPSAAQLPETISTMAVSAQTVRSHLRRREYAAWLALRRWVRSGFPLPACSRFAAIRRPTRPISPCLSRLRSGFFWQARRGSNPRCFVMVSYPIKTEVMLIEPKASSSLNISISSCGSRSAAV